MKTKKYYTVKFLVCMAMVLFVFSCKDNEEDLSFRTYEHKIAPRLETSIPEMNATIDPMTETVSLVFDKKVTVADLSKVTLNGLAVSEYAISEDETTISFQLGDLDPATAYSFVIPSGTIKGIPGTLNESDIELAFSTSGSLDLNEELVTLNASQEAKNLYKFLLDNYREKIISGTMARVNWNIDEAERVKNWTGKYPAMNTFDYIHHYGTWINYYDTSLAESWWNNNGIVSAMWHWNVPVSTGSDAMAFYYTGKGGTNTETSFDITKGIQAGTPENTILKNDLDKVANYLLALQAKNIPVIWRPLHEGAGGWFWWGAKGSDAYKKLWIMMFDTFKEKGLNNLIWVWTTESGDVDWYPGDAYVDIIGRDIYNKTDLSYLYGEYRTARRAYPDKMVTLSECGNVADIEDQWNAEAKWSWFMPWYDMSSSTDGSHAHAGKDFWEKAFASDMVISMDDMPSLK